MKILYVEDNPNDADLAQRWLRKHAPQFVMEVVATQSEAVARLSGPDAPSFDLVLTDLRLPDGDGLSLLTYIRERGLPFAVVVITGTGDEKTAVTALKAGADDYVSKRDDYLERLPLTLENALRIYRAQTARQSRTLKALYAEHHDTDINLTLRHLQRYAPHIQLDVVRTGAEALERLPQAGEASLYDVILLDYRLPGLNALETLKELRQDRALDIPVVLVTGQGDEEVALHALKLGAASYLVKNGGYLHQLPGELENACYRAEIIREQAALKQSEERLRLAQRAARVGTWDWNLVTGESSWSEGIYELLGLAQGDGRASVEGFAGLIHPEDRETAMDKVESVIRYGEDYYDEFRVNRRDGSTAWLASKGRVLRGASGSAERMIGVNINITERKQVEESLRESEARFRNMADNAPVMVWMTEADGACAYLSKSWYEFTGQTPETGLGFGWVSALHPDDRELSEKTFLAANEKREAFRLEYRLWRNDGEYRWVIDAARPRIGSQGEFLGYIGSVVDITETKQAELNTQFINQLDFELSQITDADEIIRLATSRLGEYLGVASCYVIEVNPSADLAIVRECCHGWRNDEKSIVGEYRISDFTTPEFREMLEAGHAAVVSDVMTDPRTRDLGAQYEAFGVGAYVTIPALNERQWEASLNINHPQARDWRPDETQLVRDIAARLWPAFKRARAVEALRESEERYRSVVESQTELICRFLPDATLTFVNDPYCRYFDKTQEELIGAKFLELIPEPAREVARKHVESLVENPRLEINEHEVQLPDGRIGWQQWVDHAILDEGGKVIEFQAVGRDITELKKIEEERREGKKRLRLALEAGRMGIWEWNTRTNAVKWSTEHYTVMGLTPYSVEPDYYTWADRVHPDDLQIATETMSKAIEGKGEYRHEYRIIWPDGGVRWVEGRGKPVYDEGGQCLKVSGVIVDITERKQAEDALRQSEARYRAIVEDQTELVCRVLPDGRYTFVNEAYCRYFGRKFEELIGRTFQPFIHPEDAVKVNQLLASITPSNPVGTIEHRVVLPDGGVRWHQWTERGIFDEQGRLLEFQCVGRDITQRKQAEERLMESEAQLRLLTELIPQHVWTAFPGNEADYRNQRWLDYTGMTIEEVRQKGWMTALHPDDHEPVFNAIQVASSQRRIYEVEIRLRRYDGQYRWFLARAIPQLDQEGNIIKWYGTNTDIEDRKQAEEALGLSEDKFSKAFRSSPDAFAIGRQADGMILEVNDRWEEILGYTRDEAVGRTVWDLRIYPNPGEREQLVSLVGEQGSLRDFEVNLRKKSGEIRNALISAEPIMIRDEPCLLLIVRDITERKRTELQLNTQYAISRILSEAASIADAAQQLLQAICESLDWEFGEIWQVDSEANHLSYLESWNQPSRELVEFASASRQFTFPPDVGLPGRVWKSRQPAWISDVANDCNFPRASLVQRAGLHSGFGFPALLGDETLGVMVFFSREVREPDEDLLRLMASIGSQIGQFIERRQAEESLRESEERYRSVVESQTELICRYLPDTTLTFVNDAYCRYFGKTWEDLTGTKFLELIPESSRDDVRGMIESLIQRPRIETHEHEVLLPDGGIGWQQWVNHAIRDAVGKIVEFQAVGRDLTERKRAEQSLRVSEEALRESHTRIEDLAGRLIAAQEDERRHIARELHDDLNQQVAALAIGISRLKRQFPNADAAVQEQFARLREKTDWLSERIRQVSHELHSSILQHVGLPAALNSYCAEFSDREGIAVTLDIRDGVDAVSPDAALCLYRVAQESLRNIARHSGARSAVVALAGVNGAIELRVADQGVGFDPGQARVGRGLGLASMEERVKLLDGYFELTTRPGAGTELRAQIPLRGEHEQDKGLAG